MLHIFQFHISGVKKQFIILLSIIGLFGFAISANAGIFDWLFQKSQEQILGDALYIQRVPQGGTGWGNIQLNTVLLGNGTNRISTTTRDYGEFELIVLDIVKRKFRDPDARQNGRLGQSQNGVDIS